MNWTLTEEKLLAVAKGAAIAGAGAALAYLAHWSTGLDPAYSGLAGAVISVLINLLRKYAGEDGAPPGGGTPLRAA